MNSAPVVCNPLRPAPRLGYAGRIAVSLLGKTGVFAAWAPALGHTPRDMVAMLGKPVDGGERFGAELLGWERPAMRVIVAVVGGVAVILSFSRTSAPLYPREIGSLLGASAAGFEWRNVQPSKWDRSDGCAKAAATPHDLVIYDTGAGAEVAGLFLQSK